MEPTEIQKEIIQNKGNTVVTATPGSGKTYVISEMIRNVLKDESLMPYQGVIAISYTRKASSHLKSKTTSNEINQKNSFFGTIDNFCLTQIINYFATYVYGYTKCEINIVKKEELPSYLKNNIIWLLDDHPDYQNITDEQIKSITSLYQEGYILVEALEFMALHIIKTCKACKSYLKARYTHVFIDEYQDADTYINDIFLSLVKLGITGVAVGDINQSIFGFAHKDSTYLKNLATNDSFKHFSLNENFRCSIPIINYSNRFLDEKYIPIPTNEEGVYLIKVNGTEEAIAQFISDYIDRICTKWNVKSYNDTAILVLNKRTQDIIDKSLSIPHQIVQSTKLDEDLNPRSRLYALLLYFYFDKKRSFREIVNKYKEYDQLNINEKEKLNAASHKIRLATEDNLEEIVDIFKNIADIIFPHIQEGYSTLYLQEIIKNPELLDFYKPLENKVSIMTLHKSKGLEYDIIFHLNLNEWELPFKTLENNDFNKPLYPKIEQDQDLHYVGITRARKACYLIRSSHRTNREGVTKNATDSTFLTRNNLEDLRKNINID